MKYHYKRTLLLIVGFALAVVMGGVIDNLFVKKQAQAML
jgi:hypothetical protein